MQSFPFGPGDEVVIGDLEHVSVLIPVLGLQSRGVHIRLVPSDGLMLTAEALIDALTEKTRMVVVSLVQSSSGYLIDIKKLTDACRARGIYVVTDAIQALGFMDVDPAALGIDALAASAYKGLLGIEGVGFLWCSDELLPCLRPSMPGPNPLLTPNRQTGELLLSDSMDARKLECGTLPFGPIYALSAGLDRIEFIGIPAIEMHIRQCLSRILAGIHALGIATVPDEDRMCQSFLVCETDNAALTRYLAERNVYVSCGKPGFVRISVAPFTRSNDIDRLLSVLADWHRKGANHADTCCRICGNTSAADALYRPDAGCAQERVSR